MLRRTEALEDQQFVDAVRRVLDGRPAGERDCFIFVHGFNVIFKSAALRTAQIHYDLEFQGAPLFYSWPSRGSIRSYFSDRNEIEYSAEHIKRFLLLASERLNADRIHVIAHSMGAEGVSRAIASMGGASRKFDQIILAAPDIDANLFREQLAPRIVDQSRRATMYCSRRDMALHMSYAFNDSPRIGDASRAIVPADNVDTIDASEIDTDLIGHSYYGDCVPLLHDVELLLERNQSPGDRGLKPTYLREGLAYWTFRQLVKSQRDPSAPAVTP
jgi:esterase/lipase superfamily enzyme